MDDITGMLSQVLSDPQSMQQIQALASSLGLGGQAQLEPKPAQQDSGLDLSALLGALGAGDQSPAIPEQQPVPAAGAADLSALLGGLTAGNQPAAPGGVDIPALSNLLGGILNNTSDTAGDAGGKADVSALTALLNSGAPPSQQPQTPAMPFDMNTLLKLQQAMSGLTANRANVELLMALKPRLKPERAKKVDDAVRVMQLIQFLPLIKESGLFGKLDGEGGLGGIVNGLGDNLNNLLGGLFGRGGGNG